MKERGILYSGDMVRAILEGRKWQTRRVITKHNTSIDGHGRIMPYGREWEDFDFNDAFVDPGPSPAGNPGPYLKVKLPVEDTRHRLYPEWFVGDRLYVRESHYRYGKWVKNGRTKTGRQKWKFKAERPLTRPIFFDDTLPEHLIIRKNTYRESGWYKRASIFMPKEFARIQLEITDIRVERVRDISETDATAEGCLSYQHHDVEQNIFLRRSARYVFSHLWDSINAKRGYGWQINPWVWVISFKVLA